jgi:hypothetical protein
MTSPETPQPAFVPQPAFEYQQPADTDRIDDDGGSIDVGFNQDTSFDGDNIPNANGPKPPVDRHITAGRDPAVSQGAPTAPPAGQFPPYSKYVI